MNTQTVKPIADPILRANTLGMLQAMKGKHMYEGTVAPAVVAKRRARNAAARKARRLHRG